MVGRRLELAQFNVALPREPLDAPLLADFVTALAPVNAAADASPGFVWRLATETGDATSVRAVDSDGAAFERAVIHAQRDARGCDVEDAPRGGGAPEAAVAGGGFDGDGPFAAVIAEAGKGEDAAPGGHGAGVVVAALGLVPGIALFAIVTGADVVDALDAV